MAKARTKGEVVKVRYWMHENGKMAITKGKEQGRDKVARGFKEVGPQTFARAAKAAQDPARVDEVEAMAAEVGLV